MGPARRALLGGVAFVEGTAAGWGCWELTGWFEDHLVKRGYMARAPQFVSEPPIGLVTLDPRASASQDPAVMGIDRLPAVLSAARARVVETLRAILPPARDVRFAAAALEAGRVKAIVEDGRAAVTPSPDESDRLSDIALSLFAADMLDFREFYETELCVCSTCGRVSFEPTKGRTGCFQHPAPESTVH
jgi:hypothetical protein